MISPEVAAERGYWTARRGSELPLEFKSYQRRPGLVIPVLSPSGERRVRLRPDRPRKGKDGKIRKYEQAGGVGCTLDVHPRNFHRLRDPAIPLWVVEGEKKGDSATSRGECIICIHGVWNWGRGGELLPEWEHVALEGRQVFVCFDFDLMEKWNVQLALERIVGALEDRGADVRVIYLPGPEKGIDDYFAAGGTVPELKMLASKFKPGDIGRIRLSRDQRLRELIEDLDRTFWDHEWKGMGQHSARDVLKVAIDVARQSGKPHPDGVRIELAQRPWALRAKVSARTLWKALNYLEEKELGYRDNHGREGRKSGAFVLRAKVSHKGERSGPEGIVTEGLQRTHPYDLHLRAPRLRWSDPGCKTRRGVVEGTRRVRQGVVRKPRPAIRRLGKVRGHALDVLDRAGGVADVQELAAALHISRTRDLRRRTLPMLEEFGIITVEDGRVSLTENWLEALDDARKLGKEIDGDPDAGGKRDEGAETIQARLYREQSRAYRERHKIKLDPHWTNNPEADGAIEQLGPAESEVKLVPEPGKTPAAEIVLDYVNRLGKIRLGLLEEIWLEDHGGDLRELRRAIDASGVRKEHLREYRNALFLYPPIDRRAA